MLGARTSGPDDHRRRGPPDVEQILERYRERLELDADQVTAVRPILVERIRDTSGVFERVPRREAALIPARSCGMERL